MAGGCIRLIVILHNVTCSDQRNSPVMFKLSR